MKGCRTVDISCRQFYRFFLVTGYNGNRIHKAEIKKQKQEEGTTEIMQKVILFRDIADIEAHVENDIFQYIGESQIESFESFERFNLLAFDWYDVHSKRTDNSKILIYMDAEDLFFICRDEDAVEHCSLIVSELQKAAPVSNEQLLYRFFIRLFWGDMEYLDRLELEINSNVTRLLSGELNNTLDIVISRRRELLRLKHYYEQIDTIFDEIAINDNHLLSALAIKRLTILGARTDRYLNKVNNLQELVSQMQDTYQSQLSIQQNNLMKLFTVITTIFLPLTLLVGWYGMNFAYMPELHWQYGYLLIIIVSIGIVVSLILYFKHKKWL